MTQKKNKRSNESGYAEQIEELVASSYELDPGPAKVAVLEEATRLADAHNDLDLGFEVRQELIDAATFGGRPEVSLVAFAWCLARVDQAPHRFDAGNLLWKYKWVLDVVADYPQFGRDQIADMLADMERRYTAAGSGLHPVHQTAREVYRVVGDLAASEAAHERVLTCPHDRRSNCAACEQHAQVKFYFDTGHPARALKAAEPIVVGRMRCGEVPHVTYSYLLLPMVFAGELATAADYHRKGIQLIGTNPKFVAQVARHIIFLAVTDNLTAAAKLLEKHLPNAVATTCPAWRFDVARAAAFLFDRITEAPPQRSTWSSAFSRLTGGDPKNRSRVRLPANFVLPAGVDGTDPAALRDHFAAEAHELARAFDTRGGNDRCARQIAELLELKHRIVPYPV